MIDGKMKSGGGHVSGNHRDVPMAPNVGGQTTINDGFATPSRTKNGGTSRGRATGGTVGDRRGSNKSSM